MSIVKELIADITDNLSQTSASNRDEVRVMQAMLNDTDYQVSVYGKDGIVGEINPATDFRNMCASVMSNAAKIPMAEANQLMADYSVKKSEAEAMVDISKEFINTYLQTGRKLPLGAREKSDISLSIKHNPASIRTYPMKVGVNEDGSDRYAKQPTSVPAYDSLKVHAACPPWVK